MPTTAPRREPGRTRPEPPVKRPEEEAAAAEVPVLEPEPEPELELEPEEPELPAAALAEGVRPELAEGRKPG